MNMVDVTATEQRIAERVNPDITKALAISDRAGGIQFVNAEQVTEFAKVLAVTQIGVRKHLRGNVGACLAIVVQSVEWGLSPFAVANKSYLVNDQIAFESQLIQAVILKRAPIKGRIKFEYGGEGQNRTCRAWARLRDDPDEIVDYQSPAIKDIPIKNSPLWKGDPDQQLAYYAGRALCRRHFPDVILGIYEKEELEAHLDGYGPEHARDVTPSSKLNGRLDALAESGRASAPPVEQGEATCVHSQSNSEEAATADTTPSDAAEAGDKQPDQQAQGASAETPPKADPEKIALLEKLRPKARKGTDALRRALGSISEAEEALLTDADHDALGALAEQADAAGGKAA